MGDVAALIGNTQVDVKSVSTLIIPAAGVSLDQALTDANPEGHEKLTVNDDGTATILVYENKTRRVVCDVCGGSIGNIPLEAIIEQRHGYIKVTVPHIEVLEHECPLLIGDNRG